MTAGIFLGLSTFILTFYVTNTEGIRWGTFIVASIIMAITPGANQVLSLHNGYHHGVKVAISAVSGRFTAFLIMIIAVSLGLGALLTTSAFFFQVVKWVGVAYLLYLGILTLRKNNASSFIKKDTSIKKAIKQEFLVAITNPKAYMLFAVFLPPFISLQATNISLLIFIAGVTYIVIEFICAWIYALSGWLFSKSYVLFNKEKSMNNLSGMTMIGLGVWLATDQPPEETKTS